MAATRALSILFAKRYSMLRYNSNSFKDNTSASLKEGQECEYNSIDNKDNKDNVNNSLKEE
jgi:hypothetical protein